METTSTAIATKTPSKSKTIIRGFAIALALITLSLAATAGSASAATKAADYKPYVLNGRYLAYSGNVGGCDVSTAISTTSVGVKITNDLSIHCNSNVGRVHVKQVLKQNGTARAYRFYHLAYNGQTSSIRSSNTCRTGQKWQSVVTVTVYDTYGRRINAAVVSTGTPKRMCGF